MAQRTRRPGPRGAASHARPSALTATAAVEVDSRERLRTLGTLVVLAAAVSAVYGAAVWTPFYFDDRTAIIENPSIRRLWPPLGDDVTRGPLNPPPLAPTGRRPLPNLSFALNYHWGGLDPTGYHVVSLVLHVLTAVVLAALVRRTLRLPYFGMSDGVAWSLSLAVALVWAVHPLNSETVVGATQRTELLVTLCYLSTLWAALRYWSAGSPRARAGWLVVAALACVAGMASKEIMVSAPLAVLLYERTFLVDSFRAARRSWPLYATLAATWGMLALLSHAGFSGWTDARHDVPLPVWWGTQAWVVFLYLKLAMWPHPLAIHYAPDYLRTVGAAAPWVAAVVVLALGALALAWRRPTLRFVFVVVVMVLGPTLVLPLPKMMVAERRTYLSLAGVIALAVVGGYRVLATRRPSAARRSLVGLTAVVVVALGVVTVRRVAAYRTVISIWEDNVWSQPDDPMSHYNLGVALLDAGRAAEAIRSFDTALRLEPDHTMALDNLGMAYERLGRPQDALAPLEEALRIDPNDEVAHNNLGSVLIGLGRAREAIAHVERALVLMHDRPKAIVYVNLGRALAATGRQKEALARFEEAGRLASDDPDAQSMLGDALLQAGQAERAVEPYRRALERRPDDEGLHNNLAIALLQLGRTPAAVSELEAAIRLKPEHADARFNLGRALLALDRPREAATHLAAAVRLDPTDARARFECAVAYRRSGDEVAAKAMATEGLALARAHGQTDLAGRITAWMESQGGAAQADGAPEAGR